MQKLSRDYNELSQKASKMSNEGGNGLKKSGHPCKIPFLRNKASSALYTQDFKHMDS